MSHPQHHIHLRKSKQDSKLHPYPATTRLRRFLDKAIYVVGIIGPLMTLPQLKTVRLDHQTQGISIATRGGYIAFTMVWIVYGVLHHARPIIFTQTLWLIVYSLVVIGVIVYG